MKHKGLILGIGNKIRGDDGAGLEVVRRLRAKENLPWQIQESDGETTRLIDALASHRRVIVIDAVVTGKARPGAVFHWNASAEPLPADLCNASTHNLGLSEAIEISRIFGSLPSTMEVFGIEGGRFDFNDYLSADVEKAVEELVGKLVIEAWS